MQRHFLPHAVSSFRGCAARATSWSASQCLRRPRFAPFGWGCGKQMSDVHLPWAQVTLGWSPKHFLGADYDEDDYGGGADFGGGYDDYSDDDGAAQQPGAPEGGEAAAAGADAEQVGVRAVVAACHFHRCWYCSPVPAYTLPGRVRVQQGSPAMPALCGHHRMEEQCLNTTLAVSPCAGWLAGSGGWSRGRRARRSAGARRHPVPD